MTKVRVAAAQMGEVPESVSGHINACDINKMLLYGTPSQKKKAEGVIRKIDVEAIREYNFSRMCALMDKIRSFRPDLIVFPELALTSFFPYLWIEDDAELLRFFETDDKWRNRLLLKAREYGTSIAYGYGGIPSGQRKNVFELLNPNPTGCIFKYEKVHIPGHEKPEPNETTFQFEKKYFRPGSRYPVCNVRLSKNRTARVGMVVCHDRRYNNPYIMMGLKNVQIIINGFNTPFNFVSQKKLDEHVYDFHYLPLQAQAVTEGTFIISVARAGNIFGHKQIAGSCIVSPYGNFLGKTEKLGEDIVSAELNLEQCREVKAQKYYGERSVPEVLRSELNTYLENGDKGAVEHLLSKLDIF